MSNTSAQGTDREVEVFKRAVEEWGFNMQLNMVAEECMELGKVALKLNIC